MEDTGAGDGAPSAGPARRSRFWLFAPFVLLALVVLGWTAAWFVIRARTGEALDAWIAREMAQGRRWECPGRSIGGFPFRIEVSCPQITMAQGNLRASARGVTSVTQAYQPRHLILELAGPVSVGDGQVAIEGSWNGLRSSVRLAEGGLQTASVAIDGPKLRMSGLGPAEVSASARALAAHVRPEPTRPAAEGVFDLVASLTEARIPLLDGLVGGVEPMDAELHVAASQIRKPGRLAPVEAVERWREAGGRLRIALLSLAKGSRRLEAKGELELDGLRRPAGRLEASAAGLADLIAGLTGERLGAGGGLLGALAGDLLGGIVARRRPQPPEPAVKPGLAPLPPVLLQDGKVYLGPVAIPRLRLPPLY